MADRKDPEGTLPLFGDLPPSTTKPTDYILANRDRLKRWASKGIHFGGSSWKYPGWKGIVYNRKYRSKKSFNEQSLAEYSEVFSTVCADFALYDFPGGFSTIRVPTPSAVWRFTLPDRYGPRR